MSKTKKCLRISKNVHRFKKDHQFKKKNAHKVPKNVSEFLTHTHELRKCSRCKKYVGELEENVHEF